MTTTTNVIKLESEVQPTQRIKFTCEVEFDIAEEDLTKLLNRKGIEDREHTFVQGCYDAWIRSKRDDLKKVIQKFLVDNKLIPPAEPRNEFIDSD